MSGDRMGIAVTGATGEVGRRVAEGLAARGLSQRLIVRDPARAPRLPGAEVVAVSGYSDAPAMRRALSRVDTLFLVSAHDIMGIRHRALMSGQPVPAYDRVSEHIAAVAAATAAGVQRIVYLSFVNPAADGTFILGREHFHTEEFIRSTGLAFTFLRQNMYMDKVPQHVASSDVIRAPAGVGRVAWVSRADVADAAVGVLSGGGHDGRTYDITGPEALTMAETAERLAAALGRPIRYEAQTPEEARTLRNTSRMEDMDAARRERTGLGLLDEELEIWISHYMQIAEGDVGTVSDAVPVLCGRPAESLSNYLAKHAAG
jgi:NAD(P)H dehydrogenase (quinone)